VARDETDVGYSFIPWPHFDTVEGPDADMNGLRPIGAPRGGSAEAK
jgi:hypothetical protein